jgi:uncharacterized protein YqhQ
MNTTIYLKVKNTFYIKIKKQYWYPVPDIIWCIPIIRISICSIRVHTGIWILAFRTNMGPELEMDPDQSDQHFSHQTIVAINLKVNALEKRFSFLYAHAFIILVPVF